MVVFLFDLIMLLIITVCGIITFSSKKEKEMTINIKTVTSKFTLLSIKQSQTIVRKFIREVVLNHFNNTKFKIFPKFKNLLYVL